MALLVLDRGGWSRPFRGVGPGLAGACCCPVRGGRGRSLARSLASCVYWWRSAGRSVAIVGRRAGERLCRSGSPDGPARPGVTGCRRGASSPGYSAARAEAAAPPSGPEDPALSGARTAFSPAATPTDPTRPGPARSESVAQAGRCPPCAQRRLGAYRTTTPSQPCSGECARLWRTASWDL